MPAVPYSMDNVQKCNCPTCPVQTSSSCIKPIMENAVPMIQAGNLPQPSSVPGTYCATAVGKTSCPDFNANAACQCPQCSVWMENGLGQQYYCARGSADVIG